MLRVYFNFYFFNYLLLLVSLSGCIEDQFTLYDPSPRDHYDPPSPRTPIDPSVDPRTNPPTDPQIDPQDDPFSVPNQENIGLSN